MISGILNLWPTFSVHVSDLSKPFVETTSSLIREVRSLMIWMLWMISVDLDSFLGSDENSGFLKPTTDSTNFLTPIFDFRLFFIEISAFKTIKEFVLYLKRKWRRYIACLLFWSFLWFFLCGVLANKIRTIFVISLFVFRREKSLKKFVICLKNCWHWIIFKFHTSSLSYRMVRPSALFECLRPWYLLNADIFEACSREGKLKVV